MLQVQQQRRLKHSLLHNPNSNCPHCRSSLRTLPVFQLQVPETVPGVPSQVLWPQAQWPDPADYTRTLVKLAQMYLENFEHYHDGDEFVGTDMAARIVAGACALYSRPPPLGAKSSRDAAGDSVPHCVRPRLCHDFATE